MNIFKKIYQYLFVPKIEEVKEECKTVYTMEGIKEEFPPEIQRRNKNWETVKNVIDEKGAVLQEHFELEVTRITNEKLDEVKADEIKAKRKRPYKKKNKNK